MARILFLILMLAGFLPGLLYATEYTSASFQVLDPILSSGGGEQSTSDSYKLIGAIGQINIGPGESTAYGLKSGFLYWSEPTTAAAEEAAPTTGGGEGIIMTLLQQFIPYERPAEPLEIVPCAQAADLNCDGKVGLKDLSIFLYVASQPAPNPADFNKDKKIDTRDLSALFFSWTERLLAFIPDRAPMVFERPSAEERLMPAQPATVVETLPAKEAEAPAPNIFGKITEFIGEVIEKAVNFIKIIFKK